MHIAKPLVAELRTFEVEIASRKQERLKSPSTDQVLAQSIQARGSTLRSEIHKLINSICNKEEFPQQWMESITAFTERVIKLTVVIIQQHHCYQQHTK
jgi:hypothetical protein